jgi:hypothetical protein
MLFRNIFLSHLTNLSVFISFFIWRILKSIKLFSFIFLVKVLIVVISILIWTHVNSIIIYWFSSFKTRTTLKLIKITWLLTVINFPHFLLLRISWIYKWIFLLRNRIQFWWNLSWLQRILLEWIPIQLSQIKFI